MRRILVLLSVVALMAVMMVVTVAPAFANGGGKEHNWGNHGTGDNGWHGEGNWGHWCGQDCGNHGTGDNGHHGGGNSGVGNIP